MMGGTPFDEQAIAAVFDRLTTTGCVVTTAHAGTQDGCFIGFLTPCSLDPLRLLVCTSHVNLTHTLIDQSGVLALHPIGRDQVAWVDHFGHQSGRETDKFAGLTWFPGVTGSPILADAL